ncbi:MAG: hypothetical protein GEU74_02750 [Nitriliruptorales bacterium]|nr:hypothetical protein [Nitriliruptorales bacterium]
MRIRNAPDDPEDAFLARVVRAEEVPSGIARARLSGALRERAGAYRHDAAVDLTIVEALLRLDEPEAAARHLDGHRASLHAMARDLQVAVADATLEREAERVYLACAETPGPRRTRCTRRRRAFALTGAAAVALVLLLPSGRASPRATLASLMDRRTSPDELSAAWERLDAARGRRRPVTEDSASGDRGRSSQAGPRSHALLRDTTRAILAVDSSGGSTAGMGAGSGTTTSRDRNQRSGRRATDEPRDEPQRIVPAVPQPTKPSSPLHAAAPSLPRPGEPLKGNLPADHTVLGEADTLRGAGGATAAAGTEPDQP